MTPNNSNSLSPQLPLEIILHISSFIAPNQKEGQLIPSQLEKLARLNIGISADIFGTRFVAKEQQNGRTVLRQFVQKLENSSPSISNEPLAKKIQEVKEALKALDQTKIKISGPKPEDSTPLLTAKKQMHNGWVDAIGNALQGINSLKDLQEYALPVLEDISKMSLFQLEQFFQVLDKTAQKIIEKTPSEKAHLEEFERSYCNLYQKCFPESVPKPLTPNSERIELFINFAQNGLTKLTEMLLKYKSISEWHRGLAVEEAAKNGHGNIVEFLLKNGPISDDERGKAVNLAAENGHKGIVEVLLKYGSISESRLADAVKLAAEKGYKDVVEFLLKNGSISKLYRGETLKAAAKNGHKDIVEVLLKNGPISDDERGKAVNLAAENGHKGTVEVLLKYGSISESRLADAVKLAAEKGYKDVVEVLLKNGSISEWYGPIFEWDRGEAVMAAAKNGHKDIVEVLLKNGSIPEWCRGEALKAAAQNGHEDVAQVLLKNRADL